MGILDELFRRKPEDEFLPQYAKPEEMTMEQVIQAAAALAPSVPKSEKPADPLRWAADAVGQNKDLPAPQFFMDPRALSARNMLHSALNTSANWLDGTKDPSLVGPQEMVSPFGLGVVGSMGTGVKNAMTKPSRDHSISEALGRQYPNEVAGGEMREVGRKIVVDDGKRQSWAEDPHLERAWNAAGGQLRQRNQGRKHFIEPANVNTPGPYSVMADNAKGSAPGTIINSLDMSEAARMQRAKEMGFDLPAYHATSTSFDEFNPGWRGASFFADNPASAVKGATGGAADSYGMASPSDRIMPVMLRSEHIAGLNLDPAEKAWWKGLPSKASEDEMRAAMASKPGHKIGHWYNVFDEVQKPDGSFEYVRLPVPSKTLDDVRSTGTDVYNSKHLGTYQGEQYMASDALKRGMDGFILSDEAGIGIGIADPRRIRSTQAAFDPAKRDSAMLLAADNAKGSAPGTIINSMAGDVEMSGPHWRAVSRDQSGNELGFVKGTVRDGVLVIDKSTLNPNEVGKGHGLSMYRALVDKAHEQGLRVDSASTVSGSAARVYDALERRGYRVERGPSEILDDGPRGQKVQTTDFNRRPFSIMPLADNAKGSAPGTVVNSIAEGASKDGLTAAERAAVDKRWADYYAHIEKQKQPTKKDAAKAEREQATKAEKEFEGLLNDPRHRAAGRPEDIRTDPGRPHTFRPGGGGRGGGFRADPMASAPGLAANSTQQPKDASQLSEPMLMELLRKLEEGA